eukprot:m51a1_g794 hypothetical protein (300) ;mRNA; r:640625-641524
MPLVCVCVLVGLPAAGKSTLARQLASSAAPGTQVSVVEFDCLYERLRAPGAAAFDPGAWHAARSAALREAGALVEACSRTGQRALVVVDDNMHYRSMRRPYYALACAHGAAFCEVYAPASERDALERNARRSGCRRVPEQVVRAMAATLEPPGAPGSPPWDRAPHAVEAPPQGDPRALWEAVGAAWALGVRAAPAASEEQREASRRSNAESACHQFDLRARKVVALVVAGAPRQHAALLARSLGRAKQAALQRLRAAGERLGAAEELADEYSAEFVAQAAELVQDSACQPREPAPRPDS